jgi:hypothetical protein
MCFKCVYNSMEEVFIKSCIECNSMNLHILVPPPAPDICTHTDFTHRFHTPLPSFPVLLKVFLYKKLVENTFPIGYLLFLTHKHTNIQKNTQTLKKTRARTHTHTHTRARARASYTEEWCGSRSWWRIYFDPYTGIAYTVSSGSCPDTSCTTSSLIIMLTAGPRGQSPRWRRSSRSLSVCSVLSSPDPQR